MKISSRNFNISFSARKKEIREADAFVRKARAAFPLTSSTYINTFYKSARPASSYMMKVQAKRNSIAEGILNMRDTVKKQEDDNIYFSELERNTMYAAKLRNMKELKLGNCEESATAALALLYANGYYNSEKASLCYKVSFINKETGESEYSHLYPYDHVLVRTDMNMGGEKNIVIDPWLGFADSESGAIARYKEIYGENLKKEAINLLRTVFCFQKRMTIDEFNKKYSAKTTTVFDPHDKYATDYQKKRLGEYARKTFDGIMLDTIA